MNLDAERGKGMFQTGIKWWTTVWVIGVLLAGAAAPAVAQVQTETNTTLGITAKPRIFNDQNADDATADCGPGTETGVSDKNAAIANITKKGGVDGSAGYAIGKKVPTSKCAAGLIDFTGEDGMVLNRLGFDVSGDCGAGAPRFNVDLTDGRSLFVGCAGMTTDRTFTDSKGTEWTTKRADLAALGIENAEVANLQIVFDEQGSAVLDNIAISNATLTGGKAKKHKH